MKKGTALVLGLILVAGIGLFYANQKKDGNASEPTTSNETLAEIWTSISPGVVSAPSNTVPSRSNAAEKQPPAVLPGTATAASSSAAKSTRKGNESVYAFANVYYGINPAVIGESNDPFLICVSRDRALPNNYYVSTKVCVEDYPNQKMQVTAAEQYEKMYQDARKAGVELVPYSGYRSTERQKNNFDNKIAAIQKDQNLNRKEAIMAASQSILPPGCSEHEAGLAMDIATRKSLTTDPAFDKTDEFAWLSDHAHEYGFILRYAADKTGITKIKYEPWHWRYVGISHAKAIRASGQCLEEYLGIA